MRGPDATAPRHRLASDARTHRRRSPPTLLRSPDALVLRRAAAADAARVSRSAAGSALACLCIAGPTASGKSRAAMAFATGLAPTRAVEIVSVDSAQVYRGMDIGTAKPGAAERAAVPHHLIDVLDPAERYSAARFVADAGAAIEAIAARGALPLLVGGTMLYFKALLEGLSALPPGASSR